MTIPFTRRQYERLLKLIYLGNWLVNSCRGSLGGPPRLKEYDALESHVLSLAAEFGFSNYAQESLTGDYREITAQFEDHPELEELKHFFENEVFWDELAHRLAHRDLVLSYGEARVEEMGDEAHFEREDTIRAGYEREFNEHGIDRLVINPNSPLTKKPENIS